MKALNALLLVGVIVTALLWPAWRGATPAPPTPPLPDLSLVNAMTAEDLTRERERIDLTDAGDWSNLAHLYIATGYLPEAEACYARARELDPDNAGLILRHAQCLGRIGRVDDALVAMREAVELSADDLKPRLYYEIGKLELRRDQPEAAWAAFELARDFPPTMVEIGRRLVREGRYEEALAELLPAIQQQPRELHLLRFASKAMAELGRPFEALQLRNRTLRGEASFNFYRTPPFLERIREGLTLSKLGKQGLDAVDRDDFEEGARLLREAQAVEWSPFQAEALGNLLARMGQFDEAIEVFDDVIERNGAGPTVLEYRGHTLMKLGREDEARDVWTRSFAMRPREKTAEALARLAAHQERPEDEQRWRIAMHTERGVEGFRADNLSFASLTLGEVVERAPENFRAWYYLAETKFGLEDYEGALDAARRAVSLDPTHTRARTLLDGLEAHLNAGGSESATNARDASDGV